MEKINHLRKIKKKKFINKIMDFTSLNPIKFYFQGILSRTFKRIEHLLL